MRLKQRTSRSVPQLSTEKVNPASTNLDQMSALEIATIMNAEDAKVASAVGRALPQIARAIDLIAAALGKGGRLIYVGSGTSGRLGALDASEIPPTFDTDPRVVQYIMAGGPRLRTARDGKEEAGSKRRCRGTGSERAYAVHDRCHRACSVARSKNRGRRLQPELAAWAGGSPIDRRRCRA